ncbi:MAG TPA: cyclic peptide export ABC transporter [Candidatus Acidoferrales bacterium]|jgi:putative ATP-binding cassette transporter|nr:cyclic peptide export ABC transporter [Candidatus Acidoferrales bacterium]
MNLLRFLFRNARGLTLFAGLAALLSGMCNAGLIALVNAILNRPEMPAAIMAWSFIALGLGKITTNLASQVVLAKYSQGAIANLRRDLVKKILGVPLRHLEELGAPRVMVALTEDVMTVAESLLMIPNFAVNIATLCGGAAYLCWHSWKVALGMSLFIFLGAIGYRLMIVSGFTRLHLAREEADRLFAHFRALTEGVKELKLHRSRRRQFHSDCIQTATENFSRHNVAAETRFILAQGWSQLLFFTLLGLILFMLPVLQGVNPRALTGYVVIALWLIGPLTGVLGVLSAFGRANVALEKIERLGFSLASHNTEEFPPTEPEGECLFEQLDLVDVTHSYHNEKDDSHFILGPVNLTFRPGELTFIVGGNGSGKSTLAKIITGLYPPESGEIQLDGKKVTNCGRDDYRQLFSAVFADFYIFGTLLGLKAVNLDSRALHYLAELHLEHKVKVRNGRLSTVDLSQGQRKRLALLTAYLEDRPFYLFDEWASDQDPQFKEIFYRQLLPDLKARGKAVVVITHDDRYFSVADRVIKLDYGKLVQEKRVPARPLEPVFNNESNGAFSTTPQNA